MKPTHAFAAIALLALACAPEARAVPTATIAHRQGPPARPYAEKETEWGAYRSLRYKMTIPLPHPRRWKIDDASREEIVAVEPQTRSTLKVMIETERTLMNHQLCEARARELDLVPKAPLQPIEDVVTVGPDAYDTRVRVVVERGVGQDGRLVGHVFGFGAYVTKCFLFHLATEVPSEDDEEVLSQRLALGRVRMLGGIKLEELGQIPREKTSP